jgi:exo-1,4-beta-D-glucosaminidase
MSTLDLTFTIGGEVSDSLSTAFGIRQVTSALNDTGTRVFSVNGRPIQIRGGAWAPDIFQRRSRKRQEAEVAYFRDLNLNAVRFEGKFEDEAMFDLLDRNGMLVLIGWNCCDTWQAPGSWNEDQRQIAYASLRSQMYRLRIHPSLLVFMNGSDMPPSIGAYDNWVGDPAVEQEYLNIEADLQWPNVVLSSASDFESPVEAEPTGVKMLGPYEWVAPVYWETDTEHAAGGAWSFATEISPGPSIPPLESLKKFIPPDHLWPIDDFWTYHAGVEPFDNFNIFTAAMNARYGTAHSVADYAEKAQIAAYESHRAMFEAYGRNKYQAGGLIQWMARNAWPSMIWHLYDHYLRPGGAYYGVKNATELLHVQYSYADRAVVVVNSLRSGRPRLKVKAAIYNLGGTLRFTKNATLDGIAPDSATTAFTLPELTGLTSTYFLRLTLSDASDKVLSLQTYWLSTTPDVVDWANTDWWGTPPASFANMQALATLPRVNLTWAQDVVTRAGRNEHSVTVTNPSGAVAFFVHLKITKGRGGEEVLPVRWQDNYFTLLPHESRTVQGDYEVADLGGAAPVVQLDSWNNR